jgi:hypothetical protein
MSIINSVTSKALHIASHQISKQGDKKFLAATKDVAARQLSILETLMQSIDGSQSASIFGLNKDSDLTHFRKQVPITDYEDWQHLIEAQQGGQKNVLSRSACERYQPTSGSTSAIKWIPYTQAFLDELDRAIGPWMTDLYEQFLEIKQGKHYWSLSWVPGDLRNKLTSSINDDLQLLPWWKRLFMAGTMAVPESISLAKTSDESTFATACYLIACRDLSFISVWSPTFALSLLQFIKDHKDSIAYVMAKGEWPEAFAGLAYLSAPKCSEAAVLLDEWNGEIDAAFTKAAWPNLGLISAWDTSSSELWAAKLKKLFKHCRFQGKGLWATEGVISIPYQGQYPLAINSHFYEFEDLDSKELFTSWQLKVGQSVRPIISTANGLLRYAMKDQLRVTGFINDCPCLEFVGRLSGVDMVGEKLSPEIAVNIINELSQHEGLSPISLLAIPAGDDSGRPRYVLLCDDKGCYTNHDALNHQLEMRLCQNFHYKLARELGQLDAAQVYLSSDAMDVYTSHKVARGMVEGNIKIEPLVLWQGDEPLEAVIATSSEDASSDESNQAEEVHV